MSMEIVKPVQIPRGKGGKIIEHVNENWREHLVQLAKVDNTVIWTNPDFAHAPFNLKVGESTPFGLFAEKGFEHSRLELAGKQQGEVWRSHKRSVIISRIIFQDRDGQIYRDLDLKGLGGLDNGIILQSNVNVSRDVGNLHRGSRYGLVDRDVAFYAVEMGEKLYKAGVRTSRIIAIIKLNELVCEGKIMSVDDFKRLRKIEDDFEPVLELRAFPVKTRIQDIIDSNIDAKKILIEDSKKIVSQELGMDKILTDEEYLLWFAKTFGRNVGMMHHNGLFHNYISPHNITLDCRIVDSDSVRALTDWSQQVVDIRNALGSLEMLAEFLNVHFKESTDISTKILKEFCIGNLNSFPREERETYLDNLKSSNLLMRLLPFLPEDN